MFYKHLAKGKTAVLTLYMDNIILTGDDIEELARLKEKLAEDFEILFWRN